MNMKRFLRYSGLAVAILFFFWVVALAVVYFVVDVNTVKKMAVQAVNENTNGELQIGTVELKLFPLVHFEVRDLVFKSSENFNRKELFSSKRTKLSFGILSLILGKPNITLSLYEPTFNLISDGKTNNVKDIMKKKPETPEAAATDKTKEVKAADADVDKKSALSYAFLTRFTFKIKNADVSYTSPKSSFSVKDLSFSLFIDPVTKEVDLKLIAPVNGNLVLTAELKPIRDDKLSIEAEVDATDMKVETKSFVKKRGTPLKLMLKGQTDLKSADINKLDVILVKQWLSANGKVAGLDGDDPTINVSMRSDSYELKNFAELLPALKDMKVSGAMNTSIGIKGALSRLNLSADIDATAASISGDAFNKEAGITLKLLASLATDLKSLDINEFKLIFVDDLARVSGSISQFSSKEPVLDISLDYLNVDMSHFEKIIPAIKKNKITGKLNAKAKVTGTMDPLPTADVEIRLSDAGVGNNLVAKINTDKKNVALDISAGTLDLNPYLPPEKVKPKSSGKDSGKSSDSSATSGTPAKGGLLSPSTKDEVLVKKEDIQKLKDLLSKYNIKITGKISSVRYRKYDIRNLVVDTDMNSERIAVNKKNFEIFGGQIMTSMVVGLDVEKPTCSGKLSVKGLKFKDAASVVMPEVTGVVDGIFTSNIELSASGYTNGDIQKSLLANGDFSFDNFVYSSQELNDTINTKLNDKLGKFGSGGNKKIFGTNPGWETVRGVFSIKDQKIYFDKLLAKDKEYEATGKGNMDFNNYVDVYLDMFVPYRNIPFEPMKVAGKDSSMIPIHVTGPVMKPKFDTEYTVKDLAGKILDNEKRKLKEKADAEIQRLKAEGERVKSELKAKADQEAQRIKDEAKAKVDAEAKKQTQNANDQVKKALKGLKF